MYEIIHNMTMYVWFAHLSTQLDFYVAMLPTSEVAHPAACERSTSSTRWKGCWATQNPWENLYDACLGERFARHQKKHRESWSSWKRQKSNVVSKILGFRSGIKSHTTDSRLPDLLVRVCGVIVQLPGSRRLCWAWCPSNCPDQRWLLVAWGSQIGGNATIPYKSLTKAHLDIHLDESNYNIHFFKIKRMINRQTKHIPHSFPNTKLALLHGVLSEKAHFYQTFAVWKSVSIQKWLQASKSHLTLEEREI